MLLEKLSNAISPTGFEREVRGFLKDEIYKHVDEIKVDKMGNLIVHKKGKGPKVLIDAHMDEVGFIITGFNDDGTLRFSALGEVNSKVIASKVVYVGEDMIPGVIGLKPIHLQGKEERKQALKFSDFSIDIGANSKEDAKNYIELGDFAIFDTLYDEFGEEFIKGKAFDNRVGCAILVEILKENYNCDLYGTFNVQEEIGERGAFVSAYQINADIAIVLEGTICADLPNVENYLKATELKKGPAISIMDKTSIFNKDISEDLIKIAERNNIPYQRRKSIMGGNDAGAINGVLDGAKVATVSVPCRYIHSSVSVASLEDYVNTISLIKYYLRSF